MSHQVFLSPQATITIIEYSSYDSQSLYQSDHKNTIKSTYLSPTDDELRHLQELTRVLDPSVTVPSDARLSMKSPKPLNDRTYSPTSTRAARFVTSRQRLWTCRLPVVDDLTSICTNQRPIHPTGGECSSYHSKLCHPNRQPPAQLTLEDQSGYRNAQSKTNYPCSHHSCFHTNGRQQSSTHRRSAA